MRFFSLTILQLLSPLVVQGHNPHVNSLAQKPFLAEASNDIAISTNFCNGQRFHFTGPALCLCDDGKTTDPSCCPDLAVNIFDGIATLAGIALCECQDGSFRSECCPDLDLTGISIALNVTGVPVCQCDDGDFRQECCDLKARRLKFFNGGLDLLNTRDLINQTLASPHQLKKDARVGVPGPHTTTGQPETPGLGGDQTFDIHYESPDGELKTAQACLCSGGVITTSCPCSDDRGTHEGKARLDL